MKIRKVKWANHPILGNLELNFINPTANKPYSTIVLAGENGTGKTTILETLNTFLSIGSFEPFNAIEYEIEGKQYILTPSNIPGSLKTFFTRYDVRMKFQKTFTVTGIIIQTLFNQIIKIQDLMEVYFPDQGQIIKQTKLNL